MILLFSWFHVIHLNYINSFLKLHSFFPKMFLSLQVNSTAKHVKNLGFTCLHNRAYFPILLFCFKCTWSFVKNVLFHISLVLSYILVRIFFSNWVILGDFRMLMELNCDAKNDKKKLTMNSKIKAFNLLKVWSETVILSDFPSNKHGVCPQFYRHVIDGEMKVSIEGAD